MELLERCMSCGQLRSSVSRGISTYMPHFFLVLLLAQTVLPSHVQTLTRTPTVITFEDENGPATPYFRYMYFTDSHVYVGAMEYIYRLSLDDIQISRRSPQLAADETDRAACLSSGRDQNEYECRNHVRAIAFVQNQIYACGTGAFRPTEYYLDLNLNRLESSTRGTGITKCPYSPDQPCTSIYITNGNPFGHEAMYSGTFLDANGDVNAFVRPALGDDVGLLRTQIREPKWLNDPIFVNSFDGGDYVYFFFRETALEYANCGDAVYSRIARVCKNDRGGPNRLENRWTTYLKAKLDCSISGEFPFSFDQIHDVKQIGDTYYGVFTTAKNGFYGSAVCAFGEEQIDAAFSGTFKEQLDSNSLWQAVDEELIPDQRPGDCIDDSTTMSESTEQFIEARPLMWEPVRHLSSENGVPLYHKSEVIFTKLAVDTTHLPDYSVYYLATDEGEIHKVVQWQAGSEIKTNTLVIWTPFDATTTVWQMHLITTSSSSQDDQLYLATDAAVLQLSVAQCDKYITCTDCLHDPHCGWHTWDNRCVSRKSSNSLVTSVPWNIDTLDSCNTYCQGTAGVTAHEVRIPGDPIQLSCHSRCDVTQVTWYHDNQEVLLDNSKHTLSSDNGLVIFNVTTTDTGVYECTSNSVILATHRVQLDADCGADTECIWKKNFREWCNHFDSYRREFNNWVCLKDQCLSEPDGTCMPQIVQDQCPSSP